MYVLGAHCFTFLCWHCSNMRKLDRGLTPWIGESIIYTMVTSLSRDVEGLSVTLGSQLSGVTGISWLLLWCVHALGVLVSLKVDVTSSSGSGSWQSEANTVTVSQVSTRPNSGHWKARKFLCWEKNKESKSWNNSSHERTWKQAVPCEVKPRDCPPEEMDPGHTMKFWNELPETTQQFLWVCGVLHL